MTKSNRGGFRKGARRPELQKGGAKGQSISLRDKDIVLFERLGQGNKSLGVRKAADIADFVLSNINMLLDAVAVYYEDDMFVDVDHVLFKMLQELRNDFAAQEARDIEACCSESCQECMEGSPVDAGQEAPTP